MSKNRNVIPDLEGIQLATYSYSPKLLTYLQNSPKNINTYNYKDHIHSKEIVKSPHSNSS